jgi:hypothetical protein
MIKKVLSLFIALMIAASPVLLEAKSNQSSSGKLSYKYHGGIHKTYKSGSAGG